MCVCVCGGGGGAVQHKFASQTVVMGLQVKLIEKKIQSQNTNAEGERVMS